MRAVRMLVALPALCLALSLTACSGDGDDDKTPGDADPSASQAAEGGEEATEGEEAAPVGDIERRCQAEVEVTGAAEASWNGEGTVRLTSDGLRAVYQATDGDARMAIYSEGGDFETASANFTKGDATYTTPLGDKTGLKAKVNGKSASADAEAAGIEGDTVEISAAFTCGKARIE